MVQIKENASQLSCVCRTCGYSVPIDLAGEIVPEDTLKYQCRRYPPKVAVDCDGDICSIYPGVEPEWFCGEWVDEESMVYLY